MTRSHLKAGSNLVFQIWFCSKIPCRILIDSARASVKKLTDSQNWGFKSGFQWNWFKYISLIWTSPVVQWKHFPSSEISCSTSSSKSCMNYWNVTTFDTTSASLLRTGHPCQFVNVRLKGLWHSECIDYMLNCGTCVMLKSVCTFQIFSFCFT